ncbi:MAG: hypothetical protein ACI3XT_02775, partial [Butyricicoccaceae bacterium]
MSSIGAGQHGDREKRHCGLLSAVFFFSVNSPPQAVEIDILEYGGRKMKKRLLSLLLTVGMVLGMLPVGVLADSTVDLSEDEAPDVVLLNDMEPVTAEISFTAQADSA